MFLLGVSMFINPIYKTSILLYWKFESEFGENFRINIGSSEAPHTLGTVLINKTAISEIQ